VSEPICEYNDRIEALGAGELSASGRCESSSVSKVSAISVPTPLICFSSGSYPSALTHR
jgi:hypothetical protein